MTVQNRRIQGALPENPTGQFQIAKITSESISEKLIRIVQYDLKVSCQMSNVGCQMSNFKKKIICYKFHMSNFICQMTNDKYQMTNIK